MGVGEVIVTIVAILVTAWLIFCLLVLIYGNRLQKQEMEDILDKERVKDREELIKKKAEEKKKQRESEKNKKKVGYSFDISEEKVDLKEIEGYMEVFPEIPKKKKTTRKTNKKKSTK